MTLMPVNPMLVRERLMARVKERLMRITLANGYFTEIGSNVFFGRLINGDPNPLPCIHFWDAEETAAKIEGVEWNTLVTVIEMYDKVDEDTVSVDDGSALQVRAGRMLGDIKRAIAHSQALDRVDPTFEGQAEGLSYAGSNIIVGLRPELWLGASANYDLTYTTRYGDPFETEEE